MLFKLSKLQVFLSIVLLFLVSGLIFVTGNYLKNNLIPVLFENATFQFTHSPLWSAVSPNNETVYLTNAYNKDVIYLSQSELTEDGLKVEEYANSLLDEMVSEEFAGTLIELSSEKLKTSVGEELAAARVVYTYLDTELDTTVRVEEYYAISGVNLYNIKLLATELTYPSAQPSFQGILNTLTVK